MVITRGFVFCFIILVAISEARESSNFWPASKNPVEERISDYIRNNALIQNLPKESLVEKEAISIFKASLGTWVCYPRNNKAAKQNSIQNNDRKYFSTEDVNNAIQDESFKEIYAVTVANRMPFLVSAEIAVFKDNMNERDWKLSQDDPEKCLQTGVGICGNQAATALALLRIVGLQARDVQFYYTEKNGKRYSHIIPEVFIAGKWRIIDTTYGAFWRGTKKKDDSLLASTEDVLTGKEIHLFWNSALLRYNTFCLPSVPDPFGYLRSGASVLRGGKGEVTIGLAEKKGVEQFAGLPNYIGDNKADSLSEGVRYRIVTKENQKIKIKLVIKDSAVSNTNNIYIKIGNNTLQYSKKTNSYECVTKNPEYLSLESPMDVSYLVIDSLQWEYIDDNSTREQKSLLPQ